ncbi:hypothetical protein B0T25DRAFT_550803 [Lasiosphaeria hispida]|uniref:Uncharacterized protein n=1 Tax=Lasiosphaeria hispida TaxID=260671 RepID=A0AAJ0HAH9_9PEZI|nr:hypothetical protein B0T25DRAFT_550803 [Lasiosphaeria hispida]
MGRPKGSTGRKHLTPDDRLRIRTLYYDARIAQKQIEKVTGYSLHQIRSAIRADTHQIGQRSGRPRKSLNGQQEPKPNIGSTHDAEEKDRQDSNPGSHEIDASGENGDQDSHLESIAGTTEKGDELELEHHSSRPNDNTMEEEDREVNLQFMTEFNHHVGRKDNQDSEGDEDEGRPGQ